MAFKSGKQKAAEIKQKRAEKRKNNGGLTPSHSRRYR